MKWSNKKTYPFNEMDTNEKKKFNLEYGFIAESMNITIFVLMQNWKKQIGFSVIYIVFYTNLFFFFFWHLKWVIIVNISLYCSLYVEN